MEQSSTHHHQYSNVPRELFCPWVPYVLTSNARFVPAESLAHVLSRELCATLWVVHKK